MGGGYLNEHGYVRASLMLRDRLSEQEGELKVLDSSR